MIQFNCRLSQADFDKLDALSKASGKGRSEVIRGLIHDGCVKEVDKEQNKIIAQGIAELHDQCNQGYLRALKEIKDCNHRIDRLEQSTHTKTEYASVKHKVLSLKHQLDNIMDYSAKIKEEKESGVKAIVDIQREK